MTTSHRLSPGQIEAIGADRFGDDRMAEAIADDDVIVRVAESDEEVEEEVIAGVVEAAVEGDVGEIRWLFVDPEHRGLGIGTELFETARSELRDRGVERVQATVLEANTEDRFFEQFDLERVDERQVEVADEDFVEHVYAAPSAEGDALSETDESGDDGDADPSSEERFPNAETVDGRVTATTEDGDRVYLDDEEELSGTEGPFHPAFTDEDFENRYGFYCANCGSLDAAVDNADRIVCNDCGNTHQSRSGEAYDDSYL